MKMKNPLQNYLYLINLYNSQSVNTVISYWTDMSAHFHQWTLTMSSAISPYDAK